MLVRLLGVFLSVVGLIYVPWKRCTLTFGHGENPPVGLFVTFVHEVHAQFAKKAVACQLLDNGNIHPLGN